MTKIATVRLAVSQHDTDLIDQLGNWCGARWGCPGMDVDDGLWYWAWFGTEALVFFFSSDEQAVEFKLTWL